MKLITKNEESLLKAKKNKNAIFIDFEASSLNGFPLQVAYGSSENDLVCHLIKPLTKWQEDTSLWDPKAEEIHGFSLSYVKQYGVNATTIAEQVSNDLQGKTVYSDSKADAFWMNYLLNDCALLTGKQYPIPDMQLINQVLFEYKVDDVKAVKAQAIALRKFKARGLIAHKADNDVLRHIWTWEAIKEMIEE